MNAYIKNVVVMLLALFVCFSLNVKWAYAESSTILGSRSDQSDDEKAACQIVAMDIAEYSAIAGLWPSNWYGSQTNETDIYAAASGVGDNTSITFYVGHGYMSDGYYAIYADDGSLVWDSDIYPFSSGQQVHFAFLWSCEQADEIGYSEDDYYGMPQAWLHTASLSTDGYRNSDSTGLAFIGFQGDAPMFSMWPQYRVSDFLLSFYYNALIYGSNTTINQALDQASSEIYGYLYFNQTDLCQGFHFVHNNPATGHPDYWSNGQMKVYGDGNMHLSTATPLCAMKTTTQGHFYVPTIPPPIPGHLRVELLFNDSNLNGDQTGAAPSPYSTIPNYPDSIKNGKDLAFVASLFGESPGCNTPHPWDYMADVNGDNKTDGKDITLVAHNFGSQGNYINVSDVSSQVNVIFWVGSPLYGHTIVETPDPRGIVQFPYAFSLTWGFNVTLGGQQIGAMVTFWW